MAVSEMGRMPCCEKDRVKKGPWTPEEDEMLIDYVEKHGPENWRTLPKKAGLQRCGKSCRLRWANYLRPNIKRGRFSHEEEETIIHLHSILGNKWSTIAAKLPGRTDNEIKNHWNTHIRKRLLRMGIDPVTHGPRLDLLDLPSILTTLQNTNPSSLLNLQALFNPQLLNFAQTSLGNIPNIGNSLLQNPTQINGTQMHFNLEQNPPRNPCLEVINGHSMCNGNTSFSSVFSTPCSSIVDPLDSSLAYLISSSSSEQDIESYFGNMVNKFENPTTLDVSSS